AARRGGEERRQALDPAAALARTMARVANARVVAFLAALAFAGATIFHRLPLWGYALALVAGAVYGGLAIWHERLLRAEARARAEADYHGPGVDRLEGRWHALLSTRAPLIPPPRTWTSSGTARCSSCSTNAPPRWASSDSPGGWRHPRRCPRAGRARRRSGSWPLALASAAIWQWRAGWGATPGWIRRRSSP